MVATVGDKVPDATLHRMGASGPEKVTTEELFKGKRVVLFAVPGAFTPTCSAKHLPGFVDKSDLLRDKGVDAIYCIAVNDAFVMDAWGKQQSVDGKVGMLADGNGEFTRALGLEMDASGVGLGQRSKRYAMVIDDGKITNLEVEPAGAFEKSSAEYTLSQL